MTIRYEDHTEVMVQLWEKIQEYIPQNKKEDAATTFIKELQESDTLSIDYIELIESDSYLDSAYTLLKKEDDEEDGFDVDELDFDE